MTAFITFGQSLMAIDKVIAFDIDKLYDKDIKHECYCIVAEMINGRRYVHGRYESLESAQKGLKDLRNALVAVASSVTRVPC